MHCEIPDSTTEIFYKSETEIEPEIVLNLFLNLRKSERRFSYKVFSYEEKHESHVVPNSKYTLFL